MEKLTIDAVIAIDPGAAGGLAIYLKDTDEVRVVKMPRENRDLKDLLQYYADNYRPIAFLEKLSVRPDDVAVEGDKAAMGKLYRIQRMMANFEHLKALLETIGIPFVQVHPMSWQTKIGIRETTKGMEKRERKSSYRAYAQRLYPLKKVTLWNADALLIMHFARVMLANDLNWILSNLPKAEQDKLF